MREGEPRGRGVAAAHTPGHVAPALLDAAPAPFLQWIDNGAAAALRAVVARLLGRNPKPEDCGRAAAVYAESVAEPVWRVRESARLTPSSKSIGASWSIRTTSSDGQREVWTSVDVSLAAMGQLENGVVADDTRLALRTQGRSAVEVAVKRGDHPPARIVCSATGCRAR